MNAVKPHPLLTKLGPKIHGIENPGQYLGGEFGLKRKLADFHCGLVFPDAYTIGMSNYTIKVLYSLINSLDSIDAQRFFSPMKDMEGLLLENHIPLLGLEHGDPLNTMDLVAISVGYELLATNVLNVLALGGITLRAKNRGNAEPIVIGGGPALTNPAVLGPFFDAIVIGEAEAILPEILQTLRTLKLQGKSREQRVAWLRSHRSVWYEGKTERVHRAVWADFASHEAPLDFPVPSLKVAQDHGFLEIMRGCPQGCRFCHAGVYYRPFRQKKPLDIARDVERIITTLGYRTVTLASLSSGDYPGIKDLFKALNTRYREAAVGFSLPSLKVNSFNLDLVEELANGKKSGLTFAVETPNLPAQESINKVVALDDVIAIAREAKSLGWKSAKLYFMIGLPTGEEDTMEAMRNYILAVRKASGMALNISVGTFVPKPHTPFQWTKQLHHQDAFQKLSSLKYSIKDPSIKITYQHSFQSFLEGLLARGDHRVADLVEEAWKRGARFDAWDEGLDMKLWQEVFADSGWDVEGFVCRDFDVQAPLPWSIIDLGTGPAWAAREYKRSQENCLSPHCATPCGAPCAACNKEHKIVPVPDALTQTSSQDIRNLPPLPFMPKRLGEHPSDCPALLFSFNRRGSAAYLPHLAIITSMERAFVRAAIPFGLTNGFNPNIILELAQALPMGIEAEEEIGIVYLHRLPELNNLMERLTNALPEGLSITKTAIVAAISGGRNAESLGKHLDRVRYFIAGPRVTDLIEESKGDPGCTWEPWTDETGVEGFKAQLPSSGTYSMRNLATRVLGADYLSQGLTVRRLLLGTKTSWGFDAFHGLYPGFKG